MAIVEVTGKLSIKNLEIIKFVNPAERLFVKVKIIESELETFLVKLLSRPQQKQAAIISREPIALVGSMPLDGIVRMIPPITIAIIPMTIRRS